MKKIFLLMVLTFCFYVNPIFGQYITNKGSYLEGSSYISTSRLEVLNIRAKHISRIMLSMDYLKVEGNGYNLSRKDNYLIQMNFYERNVGQQILLKTKEGKIIELSTNSIQHDPFTQVYWLTPEQVNQIINGEIIKIRIKTQTGFVDRDITSNKFSNAVQRCYTILKKAREAEDQSKKDFKKGF